MKVIFAIILQQQVYPRDLWPKEEWKISRFVQIMYGFSSRGLTVTEPDSTIGLKVSGKKQV